MRFLFVSSARFLILLLLENQASAAALVAFSRRSSSGLLLFNWTGNVCAGHLSLSCGIFSLRFRRRFCVLFPLISRIASRHSQFSVDKLSLCSLCKRAHCLSRGSVHHCGACIPARVLYSLRGLCRCLCRPVLLAEFSV